MRNKIHQYLQNAIDEKIIPGAVIYVSQYGETLIHESIGFSQLMPEQILMNHDKIFDLASLTKIVATLPAILKLIEEGQICLSDKISNFLPEFTGKGKDKIKLWHLLTHTSGLPADRPHYKQLKSADNVLNEIYDETLIAPIGSKVIYSDLGFIVLYKLIETITGKSFTDYITRNLFSPLGMNHTCFNPLFSKRDYAATEYSQTIKDYKRGSVHDEKAEVMGGISGHAGLFSTMEDLIKFSTMIEGNGDYNGKRFLSKSVLELARKNYTPFDDEYRGLGWALKSSYGTSCGDLFSSHSYGHTGFTGTSIWFDPDIGLKVILLTNRVHLGRDLGFVRLRPRLHNLIRSYF
ncbi:serine hydrolase domain-containing protein [Terrilactibacillus laevilacticus]|uniref:serine hydrolase domain-containing protein n=1 Tax=Terrilactibacillus laevilacticus TaxID=1380157 RepID=UPI001146BE68|nr:serine hydrolase domain-containing protein [Terrilactibacillus laevilacticus]